MSAPLKFEFKKDTGPISLAGLGPNPTAQFDVAFGSTQGSVIYRSASAWTALTPGSSGQFLTTNGAAANPSWGTGTGVLPSQTSNSGKLLTTDGTNAAWTTTGVLTSLTAPAGTDLTLAGGSSGASLVLGQGASGATLNTTKNITALGLYSALTASNDYSVVKIGKSTSANESAAFTYIYNTTAASQYFGFGWSGIADTFGYTGNRNLLIGTTSETGLTGAGGLKINSSTAGSSGAGALVVAGGISAAGASYFGGAVTATGNLTVGNSNTNQLLTIQSATAGSGQGAVLVLKNNTTIIGYFGRSSYISSGAVDTNAPAIAGTAGLGLNFFVNDTTNALALASTGAATFSGAVTIGNTVNTVSPTSPNRTVTMVVNGVTLYLAAKTTND